MKKTFFVPVFFLIIMVGGCVSDDKEAGYWDVPIRAEIDLKVSQLIFDTVSINLDNTSGVGSFLIYKDTLVFVDELYSTLYLFDSNFNEVDSRFGR
jgi:hypothetical protein